MSLTTISILSPEAANGRNVVAYGVVRALATAKKTGVFRPAVCKRETFTDVLLGAATSGITRKQATGVCPRRATRGQGGGPPRHRGRILREPWPPPRREAMVIVGTDHSAVNDPDSFSFNADVAADLASPVFLAVCAIGPHARAGQGDRGRLHRDCAPRPAPPCSACSSPAAGRPGRCGQGRRGRRRAGVDRARRGVLRRLRRTGRGRPSSTSMCPQMRVLAALEAPFTAPVTPYAFQYSLLGKAKADKKTIVLPEGEEDRIIKAADYLLERDIVNLIIVGDKDAILARGKELGLNSLEKASFQPWTTRRCSPRWSPSCASCAPRRA